MEGTQARFYPKHTCGPLFFMEQSIILIDLFSGIGGFAKGLLDAGIEVSHHYFSEIDKHAIANYTYNFPHAEYIGSVQNVSGQSIREKHPGSRIIVSFGWPCQDNSVAGKRQGQREGTRSGLLFEAGRIVLESKAQNFIAENVKGLSSVNEGFDFYETLRFLTYFNTDSPQYTLEMQLFNTDWFLPQDRERYYFVGHIGGNKMEEYYLSPAMTKRLSQYTGTRLIPLLKDTMGHNLSGRTLLKVGSQNYKETNEAED